LHIGINVKDRLHVRVGDHRRDRPTLDCGQIAEELGDGRAVDSHGGIAQRLERIDPVLRRLDDQRIGNAGARISPEVGGDEAVATQGDEEIVRDIALHEPELHGAGAVDLDMECRRVHDLVQMDIGQAPDPCQPRLEILGNRIRGALVDTSDPHVDRCWQAEVEDLIHNIGRLEEERDARKLGGEFLPQALHVPAGGAMLLRIEGEQDLTVG
jgi:hypothetical protein